MHIAILVTNTDDSAFAKAHPDDGEKFTQLIHLVRPNWTTVVYAAPDGAFPDDLAAFDGLIIGGSPASVHDPEPWIAQLLELIRKAYKMGVPMFGACFGHQAIALALGGRVDANPCGWIFGLTEVGVINRTPWTKELGDTVLQYAAHSEQVLQIPERAVVLAASPECPVEGFALGDKVYTTQNHPEMTDDFVAALVEEYMDKLPAGVGEKARASLTKPADRLAFAQTIAAFFEHR